MSNKIAQFTGRWKSADAQISVLFEIELLGKAFRIKAHDESDGEKLLISKVKWDGKTLSFETLTPSTKWRTRNRLKLISEKEIIHELTHWEKWEKLESGVRQADGALKIQPAQGAASDRRRTKRKAPVTARA